MLMQNLWLLPSPLLQDELAESERMPRCHCLLQLANIEPTANGQNRAIRGHHRKRKLKDVYDGRQDGPGINLDTGTVADEQV